MVVVKHPQRKIVTL